jgi:hypothetical protein
MRQYAAGLMLIDDDIGNTAMLAEKPRRYVNAATDLVCLSVYYATFCICRVQSAR